MKGPVGDGSTIQPDGGLLSLVGDLLFACAILMMVYKGLRRTVERLNRHFFRQLGEIVVVIITVAGLCLLFTLLVVQQTRVSYYSLIRPYIGASAPSDGDSDLFLKILIVAVLIFNYLCASGMQRLLRSFLGRPPQSPTQRCDTAHDGPVVAACRGRRPRPIVDDDMVANNSNTNSQTPVTQTQAMTHSDFFPPLSTSAGSSDLFENPTEREQAQYPFRDVATMVRFPEYQSSVCTVQLLSGQTSGQSPVCSSTPGSNCPNPFPCGSSTTAGHSSSPSPPPPRFHCGASSSQSTWSSNEAFSRGVAGVSQPFSGKMDVYSYGQHTTDVPASQRGDPHWLQNNGGQALDRNSLHVYNQTDGLSPPVFHGTCHSRCGPRPSIQVGIDQSSGPQSGLCRMQTAGSSPMLDRGCHRGFHNLPPPIYTVHSSCSTGGSRLAVCPKSQRQPGSSADSDKNRFFSRLGLIPVVDHDSSSSSSNSSSDDNPRDASCARITFHPGPGVTAGVHNDHQTGPRFLASVHSFRQACPDSPHTQTPQPFTDNTCRAPAPHLIRSSSGGEQNRSTATTTSTLRDRPGAVAVCIRSSSSVCSEGCRGGLVCSRHTSVTTLSLPARRSSSTRPRKRCRLPPMPKMTRSGKIYGYG